MAITMLSEKGDWGIDSRIQAVRERWQIPHGAGNAGASPSQHALGKGGPLHFHTQAELSSQTGDPISDRERPHGQMGGED